MYNKHNDVQDSWELHHLEIDRTAMHNQAGDQLDRVRKTSAVYDEWATGTGIDPNS